MVDPERVSRLFQQFNDEDDVAAVMGCTVHDLDDMCRSEFGVGVREHREACAAQGRAMIRSAQFQAALDGDRSMLLALGKQYLGQDFDSKQQSKTREVTETSGGTALSLVLGRRSDAPDRKSRAAR